QAADGRDALSSLERRIDALSAKVNTRAADTDSRRLESMIEGLADQLQRLDLGETYRAHLGQIENQIAILADRIQASEARFGHADLIERGLADLRLQIEEVRVDAGDSAAVRRDLADLRVTQAESDRRIQQVLGTIQDTIEGLADRLTTIESDARAEAAQRPDTSRAAHAPVPAYASAPPARRAPPAPRAGPGPRPRSAARATGAGSRARLGPAPAADAESTPGCGARSGCPGPLSHRSQPAGAPSARAGVRLATADDG